MHAKQVLAFRLRSGLRPLAPPALQNLFRVASVLHQHETKRKSSHHPHDGFNESADIPTVRKTCRKTIPVTDKEVESTPDDTEMEVINNEDATDSYAILA